MMIELYPHNQKAYENAKFIFESEDRTTIVHPTGTGKSLIIGKFILENPNAKFLFISPNTFIHKEIKKHIKGYSKNVDFQTYQYFLNNAVITFINYDFIFLDEFHRAGAEEWNKQIEELLSINPTAKKLGTTATHIRYLDNERNMVDELFQGNISSYMTLGEVIEKGIHKKPSYVSALYSVNEIIDETATKLKKRNRIKELANLKSRKVIWEESNGIDFIIKKYLTHNRNKILVFCKSIEHIKFVQNLIAPILSKFYDDNIEFSTIHSYKKSKNASIFSHFEKAKIPQVIFCVDMLNEGIHVKGVDTIMMFRDTSSPIIYFQQMGRAFSVGQKLQPLIFDFVNNFNIKSSIGSIIQNFYNDFKNNNQEHYFKKRNLIIDFYDETLDFQKFINGFSGFSNWEDAFEKYSISYKEHQANPTQKEMRWVSAQKEIHKKGQLSQERINKLLSVNPNFFENENEVAWNNEFNIYQEYFQKHQKNPPKNEMIWASNQKAMYKKGKLLQGRINKLLSVNSNFFEDKFEVAWNNEFNIYQEYFQKHQKNPPQKEGSWVGNQKTKHRIGLLSQDRIDKLISVNPNFFENENEVAWNNELIKYQEYFQKHQKNPPHNERGWIDNQKKNFKDGKLSQERIDKLISVNPYFFQDKFEVTWNNEFNKYQKYFQNKIELPTNEMRWMYRQRAMHNKGKLSQERIDKLISVNPNFFEEQLEVAWNDEFNKYQEYFQKHQKNPPQKEGSWVTTQKAMHKKGKLFQDRIDKLISVNPNFFENINKVAWNNEFNKYQEYFQKYQKNPLLKEMSWVSTQKAMYKKGKLSQERIDKLISVNPNFFK